MGSMTALSFEAVWSAIPYPALVIGPDNRVKSSNVSAETFLSASERQMRRRDIGEFLGKSSAVSEVIAQVRAGAVSVVLHDIELFWLDRPLGLVNIHAATIVDEPGFVILMIHPRGLAEKMDRSLSHRSAARSVTGMAAMLAHEIRNPISGISGAAQLLAMGLSDADRELTDLIQQEALRIGKLVERVEAFGDIRPASRDPVNIHDVLNRAARSASAGFAAHIRIKEEYDPSLPRTSGDADQLQQVFLNLLKNAAEAVPQVGGQIVLRTAYRPGVRMMLPGKGSESLPLLVTIIDNGHGVPPELARDIFEPFVSSKANGTGLGLSLVSKIIADHGGTVDCESEAGRTQFNIQLPVWYGSEENGEA